MVISRAQCSSKRDPPVVAFADTMSATDALQAAQRIELLITRIIFPPGQPNGVSLPRMARVKRPGVKIMFAARPETREHTEGVGEFQPAPATPAEIVEKVERMLAEGG